MYCETWFHLVVGQSDDPSSCYCHEKVVVVVDDRRQVNERVVQLLLKTLYKVDELLSNTRAIMHVDHFLSLKEERE